MARRSKTGFTLIEMMVVIGIVAVLIALLVPTLSLVKQRARIRATRALVDGISTALERYRVDFDDYPPSTAAGLLGSVDPSSLYLYLAGPGGKGLDTVQGGVTRHRDPYLTPAPEYVQRVGGQTLIVDAWGSPLVFLNCKTHVELGGTAAGKCHHPQSFDLYSVGPDKLLSPEQHDFADSNNDGRVDEDAEGGDDITNWPGGIAKP